MCLATANGLGVMRQIEESNLSDTRLWPISDLPDTHPGSSNKLYIRA